MHEPGLVPDSTARGLLIHFGQLGDAVMALPAARALQSAFPQIRWTVMAARGGHAVFEMAGFEEVWGIDRRRWKQHPAAALLEIPQLIARMRRRHFDISVDLHSFKETNLMAWLAGIPQRAAMLRPTRTWPALLNRLPPPDDPDARLLDRYCQVLQAFSITVDDRVPWLDIPALAQEAVAAQFQQWESEAGPAPILGIYPGAGNSGKRWPVDRFIRLAQRLQAKTEARIAVFTGPEEHDSLTRPFLELPRARLWPGLPIPELAAALAQCRAVVSNPTGPSHIAAAVGASVCVLGEIPAFDPTARPPGVVVVVRSPGRLSELSVDDAWQGLCQLWPVA